MSVSKKSKLASMWFGLTVSLFVHLLLLAVFILQKKVEITEPKKADAAFVVEITSQSPTFSKFRNHQQKRNTIKSDSQTLSRDILFPKYSFSPDGHKAAVAEDGNQPSIYDKYSEGGVFHTMDSIGLDEYNSMSPFLQALWQKVEANLDYPEDFARQRIAGRINVHLLVDNKGLFVGDFLELAGENDLLKTYVAASLVHALGTPLPKIKWNSERKTLPVLLSFNFETYSIPEPSSGKTNLSVKNALLFERRKFVDPKINEDIETFFTKYFPPIIPIGPGVLYIDFVYAYKMLNEYGKPTAREKRQERLESLKERLSRSLKQKEPL